MSQDKSTSALGAAAPSAPRDLLARAFLEILARDEGARLTPMLRNSSVDDDVENLLDELNRSMTSVGEVVLRPDVAAAAILTARAIEAEPGLARRLRRGAPVVIFATHTSDLVERVKDIFIRCVLPAHAQVLEAENPLKRATHHDATALLVARDGTDNDHRPEKGNRSVASALHRRMTIVGIAPDPVRHLPSTLLRSVEHALSLPALDETAVALVIEVVTGKASTQAISNEIIRLLDLDDLLLAIRSHRTADQCVVALDEMVRRKTDFLGSGPSLEDLDGYGAAKTWGLELAEDMADFKAGRLSWDELSNKGLLLSGPPGVGKTQFARALAKSARVPLVSTSVAQWNSETYLSNTLQAIRDAFSQARRQAPCILFIDEIDGISDRSQLRGDFAEYWTQIVNLLLEQLASVDDRPGVVVVSATNHPDKIDAAIKRAGRLDKEIVIEKPDPATLARIFRHHLGEELLVGIDLMPLSLAARGATGADAEAFVRRARGAARRAKRPLEIDDVLAEIRAGRSGLPAQHRRRIAIHEAGHAIVSHELQTGAPVGLSLHDEGGSFDLAADLSGASTLERCQDEIAVLLAGRVAENLLLGDVSIGSGLVPASDLCRATNIACAIEGRCGMGQFGSVYIENASDFANIPGLLTAVQGQLDRAEAKATEILSRREAILRTLSGALEQVGYLSADQIEQIISGHEVQVVGPADEMAQREPE